MGAMVEDKRSVKEWLEHLTYLDEGDGRGFRYALDSEDAFICVDYDVLAEYQCEDMLNAEYCPYVECCSRVYETGEGDTSVIGGWHSWVECDPSVASGMCSRQEDITFELMDFINAWKRSLPTSEALLANHEQDMMGKDEFVNYIIEEVVSKRIPDDLEHHSNHVVIYPTAKAGGLMLR